MGRTVILILFLAIPVIAIGIIIYNVYDTYHGWGKSSPVSANNGLDLKLIKPIPGLSETKFSGDTEFEAVQQAATWVATNMRYEENDTWTPSDEQYYENPRTGDSDDYAVLLCALLRFHTQGGTIPNDRVWVSAKFDSQSEAKEKVTEAWVGYRLEGGGLAYIEPRTGLIRRGRPQGTPVQ
jgi:hypothetical protein